MLEILRAESRPAVSTGHDCQGSPSPCMPRRKFTLAFLNDPLRSGGGLARFAVGLLLAFAALLASQPAQAQTPLAPTSQAELDDLLVGKRLLLYGDDFTFFDFISPGHFNAPQYEGSYSYEQTDPNTGEVTVTLTVDNLGSLPVCFIFDSRTAGRMFFPCGDEFPADWRLVDIPVVDLGAPTAPVDQAAFHDLVVGKRMVLQDDPHHSFFIDFVSRGRSSTTTVGYGGTISTAGSYSYEKTGPNTGTVFYNYDADRKEDCTSSITFDSRTTGWLSQLCGDNSPSSSLIRLWRLVDIPSTSGPTQSFLIPHRGGQSTTSSGSAETLRVGYGRIRAAAGSTTPSGVAIFQFRDSEGVLISEAGVPATEAVRQGRIFAEVNGPVNTGLAIANPNDVPATIRFYFTDSQGVNFGNGSFELPAHEHTAAFLDQPPFNEALPDGSPVLGTFTFESSAPIAVTAIRGLTNEAGEFLMTTLPAAPLSLTSSDTVYFPHFADGGGWVTQVILVNPTDRTITGTAGFLEPGGGTTAASPVTLTLDDGSRGSDFDYSIPSRSSQRFTTSNPPGRLSVGSVRATPNEGTAAPSGLVIFSYAQDGKTLSEAGVPALPKGTAFRAYVESSGTLQAGSIQSGLAITNTAATSNTVTLEVTRLDGSLAAPPATLALPPSGQIARFVDEIFALPDNFSGVLRVTSTGGVAMVALRLRVNERGEVKMTTTSPSNEMDPPTSEDRFFAHLADSGGWSTQFILFSRTAGQNSSGTLSLTDALGEPLE